MIESVIKLILQVGFPATVALYFMFRDYKYFGQLSDALTKIAENLAVIKDRLEDQSG